MQTLSAADNLFTSPPHPQPLPFSSFVIYLRGRSVLFGLQRPLWLSPLGLSDQDQPQHDPDPPYYREVALSDVPSQYAEEVDTFRRILSLPDPRESMSQPQPQLWVWMMKKAIKSSDLEVLPLCYHSAQLSQMPLISLNIIFRPLIYLRVNTSNLLLPLQELNTDFAKICITPKPPGAPMGKVPLPILKELEHQARQNISTLNFTAVFAKTSSSCNASLEKCQHSLKSIRCQS